MKNLYIFFLFTFQVQAIFAQNFTKITSGSIVNDGSSSFGVSWADYDNDNDLDLFVGNVYSENDKFYVNNGNGTFTETTSGPLVTDGGTSENATWGDYDNDGDIDLFLAMGGANPANNRLYRNEGNGSFLQITSGILVTDGGRSIGATWGDYDNDGLLDLFVANFSNSANFLYHNDGSGNFSKITTGSIVTDLASSVTGTWVDYDNDNDLDLFVTNWSGQNNNLYMNNGDGTFTKITSGDLVNNGGNSHGSSWADYNNDGFPDVFVSNGLDENNFLYKNNGNGTFTRIITGAVVTSGGTSTSSSWADYDNDGDLDLFVGNSSVQSTTQNNFLYENDGTGNFIKLTTGAIPTEANTRSRGAAWGDYDYDGDIDLYVANETNTNNLLYRNDGNTNHWVNINCVGTVSNVSAIGTRLKAKATINGTAVWQSHEISTQTGYASQNSLNVEFGFGDAEIIDSLIIRWPSGIKCVMTNLNTDNFYVIAESCGISAFATLSGNVFHDNNSNCLADSSETRLAQRLIKILPGPLYASTDSLGNYSVQLLTGTYSVELMPIDYWSQTCPGNSYSISIADSNGQQYPGFDFGNEISTFCPDLSVDISTGFVRRCFNTNYYVQYCNKGTLSADNAFIDIIFDSTLTPVSSPFSWTVDGKNYRFNIGTVQAGYCGSFPIVVYVSCNAILGSTKCVEARIFPDTFCVAADSTWDKSSIRVEGYCDDSLVCFAIYNTGDAGDGDMNGTSQYRIYSDNILISTQQFQLNGNDSLLICLSADGSTLRLEADQRPGHPGNSHPQASVELCGDSINPSSLGQITLVPEDDEDDFVEIDCRVVTGSYDPNDKSVKPLGLMDERYIDSTAVLEYHINFQNTGTDTAFTVVILDTLSPYLDITSVKSGASSHPYSFKIKGENILEWKFSNILLPDSNVDEPGSHGFIKFKVEQVKFNTAGTIIENEAGIIFDFNDPVITNTTFNTVGIPLSITYAEALVYDTETRIKVYPNPFNTVTTFYISGNGNLDSSGKNYLLEIFDIVGQKILTEANMPAEFRLYSPAISNGIYFYKISSGEKLIGTGKLIFE